MVSCLKPHEPIFVSFKLFPSVSSPHLASIEFARGSCSRFVFGLRGCCKKFDLSRPLKLSQYQQYGCLAFLSLDHWPRARHPGMWSQVGLRSITKNKASGGDGIPVDLFQILKDNAVKVLHSICQQIWKPQQWPQGWKRSVFIPIPKKGNAKECSNYCTHLTR